MTLRQSDITNFETLKTAFMDGNAALVESRDNEGRYVALICAISTDDDGETFTPVPFAELVRDNPFEIYADPTGDLPPETGA